MYPPRILIVSPDQRSRALLRAELREAGYDAIGASSLTTALRYPPHEPDRGPVRLFIIDGDAAAAPALLERTRARYPESRFLLIQSGAGAAPPASPGPPDLPGAPRPPGPWQSVLRRPITIGEIVAAARELVPLPPELQVSIDR